MSLFPPDDHLPESFFTSLFPELGSAETPAFSPDHGRRMARLVEQWPGAVFCLDAQLRCLLTNHAARAWSLGSNGAAGLLGFRDLEAAYFSDPAEETQPTPLFAPLHELLHEDLLHALAPYLASALRGESHHFEGEFKHPLYGMRWLSIRVLPDYADGQFDGLFLHLQDITAQRQAAPLVHIHGSQPPEQVDTHTESPDPSATRLRLMTEGIRDVAIFFLDTEGKISEWPQSAERLLGYRTAEVLGRGAQHFDDPDEQDSETADTLVALERAALLGQCETTGWRIRSDGSRFWANTVLTALNDETTGESRGYSCLMRDVTELKRLEDLFRQLNQELEARVQDRTQQLQEINRDLESFSYSVSHDLRAPLRHISSFVDMLQDHLGQQADETARKYLSTISHSATHMGQLIEGLLAFARLGRAALSIREISMGSLLQASLNRLQHDPLLQKRKTEVEWEITMVWPHVHADGLLLSQVWDNLVSNALKYTRPRPVARIEIGWRKDAELGRIFWVRDNGVGFDPRRAEKLFGVFQRLHRPSEFEGTGIGLALCRRIVERHGGRIWAESVPGEGSTFSFSLPLEAGRS